MSTTINSESTALIRVSEVAKALGLSRSKVYVMMDQGELPYVKLGTCRRIKPEDLARLVRESTVNGGETSKAG